MERWRKDLEILCQVPCRKKHVVLNAQDKSMKICRENNILFSWLISRLLITNPSSQKIPTMKNKTETCLRNSIVMALKTRDSQGHPSEAGEKRKTLGF